MHTNAARANIVILILFATMVLFYFDEVRERLLPPMYDDASSFSRVEPRPGWTDTGIIVRENRPVAVIASGKISTPRLTHSTASVRNKPFEIGPEGADLREELLPDWREEDDFPAFALLGRVNGGKPFLVGRGLRITTSGRLELKINCLLWDKSILDAPGTSRRRRKGPLTAQEVTNLRLIRGFFAYRTWELGSQAPQEPHLPGTASEITKIYAR